jgi:DNA-directed RNA polymerase specialized sigma24 family protein
VAASAARGRLFPSTRWTLIRRAQGSDQARKRALDELLCMYWKPLFQLARLRGLDPQRAADAVQGFSLRLLEGESFVDRLDPARGRLRSFLRSAFAHHLQSDAVHAGAQKRGGNYQILSLELSAAELAADPKGDPTAEYDRQWALTVLDRALRALEQEFAAGGRRGPFEVLASYFRSGEPPSYEDVARRHAMSVPQVKAFLHRARARYRQLVEQELRDTLDPSGDAAGDEAGAIDAELRALLEALRA